MINTRKFGGGYCIYSTSPHYMERGNGSVRLVPSKRLPKGGLRCTNTSMIGGVMNG